MPSANIRPYHPDDYHQLAELYRQHELYGGQFDPDRDSEQRLAAMVCADEDAILVAELGGRIVGTVSLIEDERTAWLFRFAVTSDPDEQAIAKALAAEATLILRGRGHEQVLVYSPLGNRDLERRYEDLGFARGGDYTCYWMGIGSDL